MKSKIKYEPKYLERISKSKGIGVDTVRVAISKLKTERHIKSHDVAMLLYAGENNIKGLTPLLNSLDDSSSNELQRNSITMNNTQIVTNNSKRESNVLNMDNSSIHGDVQIGNKHSIIKPDINMDIQNLLTELKKSITESVSMNKEDIAINAVNIDTLQSQINSPKPNKGIIKAAWDAVQTATTLSDFSDVLIKITPLVTQLISNLPG